MIKQASAWRQKRRTHGTIRCSSRMGIYGVILLALALALGACQSPSSPSHVTGVENALPTPTLEPTFTPSPFPTDTPQPSPPTDTPVPTAPPRPSPTPTIVEATPAKAESGKIAFVSWQDSKAGLYSMNPDGSGLKRLISSSASILYPTWSPDAGKIAFISESDSNRQINLVDADGRNASQLTQPPLSAMSLVWSPDSRRIAFTAGQDNASEIYVVFADGTGLSRLAPGNAPAWSPDSQQLVFVSDQSGKGEILAIKADGSGLTRLAGGLAPAWSPDGKHIAFVSGGEIYAMPAPGLDGQTEIDANRLLQLTEGVGDAQCPTWSPDGHHIAIVSKHNLYVISAPETQSQVKSNGQDLKPLASGLSGFAACGVWSPDGQQIAVRTTTDVRYAHIFVVSVDGSMRRVDVPADRNGAPAWSPKGGQIVLVSGQNGLGLDVIDTASGNLVRLAGPGLYAFPAWSP
jgi:Tol biopolymer transport system component